MTVYLVGAGPGDPGLITVRGAEVLSRAGVVLYDRLVAPELLELAPAGARRIDVGKRVGEPGAVRQPEINELLVRHGREGTTVVRLKGGDPYVFGRGGEEAEALVAAGVPFEVVPGVSSAFSVPAVAGVPVTHRGLSRSVTVVTGHVSEGDEEPRVDWEAMARAGGTLVVMMGAHNRAEIARRLVSAGRPADTPVLVVANGTTRAQKQHRCTLASLGDVDLEPPSIIVIGEVAGLGLVPVRQGPLSGLTVVVTRAANSAGKLVRALEEAGAQVKSLPLVAVAAPADGGEALRLAAARAAAGEYEWVAFTSSNAVHRFVDHLGDARLPEGTMIAAVGVSTAAAVASRGLVADVVPESASAGALVVAMPDASRPRGQGLRRILFPRAEDALGVLAPGLRERGWEVDEVVAYRTVRASPGEGLTDAALAAALEADVLTFASPSAVRFFSELAPSGRVSQVVACIGPTTADAARDAGLRVEAVALEQTDAGLVQALVDYFSCSDKTRSS